MISNERPSPWGNNSRSLNHQSYQPGISRPPSDEEVLKLESIQIEKKKFVISLKENPRGRFLRITEETNGKRSSIIIPSTGLNELETIIRSMVQANAEIPLKETPDEQ